VTDRLPDDALTLPPGAPPGVDAKLVAALERIGQALRVQIWDTAKRQRLSPTQLQVLLRLANDPAARRRMGSIGAEVDLTHPTVSDAVAALRHRGLVERETPSRRAPLALTEPGRELAAELVDWDERILRELGGVWAAEKQATLRLLLDLIAGLQRAGAITVARMCVTCRFFRRDAHPATPRQHHCALVDMPLADGQLRVDCAEHEPRAA
jgi:DNA-binding MarR family transcriptional regulator